MLFSLSAIKENKESRYFSLFTNGIDEKYSSKSEIALDRDANPNDPVTKDKSRDESVKSGKFFTKICFTFNEFLEEIM